MTAFILLAIALTGAAIALLILPLLRRGTGVPARGAAILAASVLVAGSASLYWAWSDWSWPKAPAPDSPQGMVARLAWKLERNPSDPQGWMMLGRSYVVLQQLPLALRAYEHADRLFGGRNAEAILGIAEVLVLEDETELDGRAGRLIERALALDPQSGQALFYGAAIALRHNQLPLARERFSRLLTLDPPANIKPLLERQITEIDRRLAADAK